MVLLVARSSDIPVPSSDRFGAAGRQPDSPGSASLRPTGAGSIEALVEDAVYRAVARLLEPHLARLSAPEPLVYTVAQAALTLQVSPDTVARLVRRGALDRVPHVDGKLLIPRGSLERLVAGPAEQTPDDVSDGVVSPLPGPDRRRTRSAPPEDAARTAGSARESRLGPEQAPRRRRGAP
jgi:hypothetical protein